MLIYEPKGKAREYSPLALNIYNGCDHACNYCYLPKLFMDNKTVKPRDLSGLEKELQKQKINKQILLSFACDPYCQFDVKEQCTRKALQLLLRYNCLIAILTKGGNRILRDEDLITQFQDRIKVGITLTTENGHNEPHAAPPLERIETLKYFNQKNIKTFVSFEPIISFNEFEKLFPMVSFADELMIGLSSNPKYGTKDKTEIKKIYDLSLEHKNIYYKHSFREKLGLPHQEPFELSPKENKKVNQELF